MPPTIRILDAAAAREALPALAAILADCVAGGASVSFMNPFGPADALSWWQGIAEAVEWANAATVLEKGGSPWPEAFRRAIGVLIKDEEDLSYLKPELERIVEEALG